jgi:hypothetical protein
LVISFFDDYIKQLQSISIENITEFSMRSALEILLHHIADKSKNSNKIKNFQEPKRKENYGAPDFLIFTDCSIIGYIENKKISENLDKILKSEQIKKYREITDNILLTNYVEFVWIKGDSIQRETLCYLSDIENKKFKLDEDKVLKVKCLIENFISEAPKKISNPFDLAAALAKRCKILKEFLFDELNYQEKESKKELLFDLYDTFKNQVFHELIISEFSDAFAQMLVYSLFLAKLNAETNTISLENVKKYIPVTFQLIRELVKFLDELKKSEYIETKWIIDELLSIMNNLDLFEISRQLSFSKRVKDKDGIETDPYIYFYENFLAAYDKDLRKSKGVYYTPQPEVNFIVRLIDDVLKDIFQIQSGLADYQKVTILDFATGTGTFIIEIFKLILEAVPSNSKAKKDFIIKEHLLKNIYGFEYLIAPYTIAHLKLSQFLKENGYIFQNDERLQVFLTNTLEPVDKQVKIPFLPQLSKETQSAQRIKDNPILVITGNPPYSGHSKNTGEWISSKIQDYYFVDGKPLGEKNSKWLQDDYVKFIRFAQDKMDSLEQGVIGIITNHSFLDNPTFRGMRQSLMNTFDQMYFIDLHGNAKKKEKCPDGSKDVNIFDIEQGVAISILVKKKGIEKAIYYTDFWGTRMQKHELSYSNNLKNIEWYKLKPTYPFYLFKIQNEELKADYYNFLSINDIFNLNSVGIVTARDEFTIKPSPKEVWNTINKFVAMHDEEARNYFNLGKDARDWKISLAKKDLIETGLEKNRIVPISYRPFDTRFTYYTGKSRGFHCMPRKEVMFNLQDENINLSLNRSTKKSGDYDSVFVSKYLIDAHIVDNIAYCFPLYILKNGEEKQFFGVKESQVGYNAKNAKSGLYKTENLNSEFRKLINNKYNLYNPYTPEEILGYIYAILHSPTYRTKYSEFLKNDFPRIPFCDTSEQFEKLSKLGCQLIDYHLMRFDYIDTNYMQYGNYISNSDNIVEKAEFINGKLFINKIDYFENVPEDVWNFNIGGYQVLSKYLKDRKGKDIFMEFSHIENVIRILAFTIRQMEIIDEETSEWI